MMNVVLISNLLTPHQLPLCEIFHKNARVSDFFYLETIPYVDDLPMGWKFSGEKPQYVISYEKYLADKANIDAKIIQADVVIIGSAPEDYIVLRLKQKKLTFKYSERFYKTPFHMKNIFRRMVGAYLHHGRFQKYPLYMLSASAYTASDAAVFGNYKEKCFRWGYFPATKKYDSVEELGARKKTNALVWVGRLIDWKHPELPVQVAKRLKAEGYDFQLNMIGNGELEESLHKLIRANGLEDCVHLLGSMKPQKVREYMERSQIFLFTSDRNEGWGAVLNESMNSGCAVVASHAIGSVPFLIEHEKNGLIYEDGDFESLYSAVKKLLDTPELCRHYGENAYHTIVDQWNAETAAERLLTLAEKLKSGKKAEIYQEGPCSKAEILDDGWFHK